MASNPEKKPETKDKPHPIERRPKQDIVRELGKKAIERASKDTSKK